MSRGLPVVALALVTLASGCPRDDRLYGGDPSWPREVVVPEGLYVGFTPTIPEAGRSPLEVSSLSPRCEPAAICSSLAFESRVLVFGAEPGAATVTVNYTHPVTGVSRDHQIPVRVIPAARTELLGVGDSLPAAGTGVSLSVDDTSYRCLRASPSHLEEEIHYQCAPALERAGGSYQYGGSDRALKNQVRACVISVDGTVAGIALASSPPRVLGDVDARCRIAETP